MSQDVVVPAKVAIYERKEAANATRRADVQREFIAKTGFLATACGDTIHDRKLSCPWTGGPGMMRD